MQFAANRDRWLYSAANGGVLVSPFISKREKEIRTAAEQAGGRLILITPDAFGERFKPAAHDFNLCSEGRMLMVSLGLPASPAVTRDVCLSMNAVASGVAEA